MPNETLRDVLRGRGRGKRALTSSCRIVPSALWRPQITTRCAAPLLNAIEDAFGADVDYAYAATKSRRSDDADQRRYSLRPASGGYEGSERYPDPKHVSTSYRGATDLTMRMSMPALHAANERISKKLENHGQCLRLYFCITTSAVFTRR